MQMFFLLFCGLLLLTNLYGDFPPEVKGQILYHMHKGEAKTACQTYLSAIERGEDHDFTLLQQAGICLLEEGSKSSDDAIQLMCQFGAGVASTPSLLPILERGIRSKDLKIQLASMSFLAKMQDDRADNLLWDTLISSPFLLSRLEAGLQLAKKNYPNILEQLQSLYYKMPALIRSLFPQIIVLIDNPDADSFLHQLISETDLDVRIEAILQAAKAGRDELLPQIRAMASQSHFALTETCIYALGILKDEKSLPVLHQMSMSKRSNIQLAASAALYALGDLEAVHLIEKEAMQGNLFAIAKLGECDYPSCREVLVDLLKSEDTNVRLNATLSLVILRDERAFPMLSDILIRGNRDIGFASQTSPGRSLKYWKIVPSANQHTQMHPGIVEQSQKLREKILLATLDFPEATFFKIIHWVFDQKETDLIPVAVELLRNHRTPETIAFLKDQQQKAGAPLIRNYCNLALYQLGVEGPYEELLIQWVSSVQGSELIKFRDSDPSTTTIDSRYVLTPEETSALLISAFEALAQAQNERGIEALIRVIAYGNPKNRYALAGLLIRTTE